MPRWIREIYLLMLLPKGRMDDIDNLIAISGFTPEGKLKWHFSYKGRMKYVRGRIGQETIPVRKFIQRKIDLRCQSG